MGSAKITLQEIELLSNTNGLYFRQVRPVLHLSYAS
jgi:hypothetical protein